MLSGARRIVRAHEEERARLERALKGAPAPPDTEARSVLSELWHAESRCGSDLLQVQFSSEERGGAQVQGHDADDESAGIHSGRTARAAGSWAAPRRRTAPSGRRTR